VILAPSGVTLGEMGVQAEILRATSATSQLVGWVNAGLPGYEAEFAAFGRGSQQAISVSVQTTILPETLFTPAISAGVRDLGNDTRAYGAGAYHGRSEWIGTQKTFEATSTWAYPVRNLGLDTGVSAGGMHGIFGALTGDLPLRLIGTLEWDTRDFNERLAVPVTPIVQAEFVHMEGQNYLGLEAHSPISF
jgi:hypothetical protein